MVKGVPVYNNSFKVTISDITTDSNAPEYFSSVEGLSKTMSCTSKSFVPGGEKFTINLHESYSTQNLILSRPILNVKSPITKWCQESIDNIDYTPKMMMIFLLAIDGTISIQWTANNVFPLGLEISPIKIENGATLVEETIRMYYSKLVMEVSNK